MTDHDEQGACSNIMAQCEHCQLVENARGCCASKLGDIVAVQAFIKSLFSPAGHPHGTGCHGLHVVWVLMWTVTAHLIAD